MNSDKYEYIKELKGWINGLNNEMNNRYDELIEILKGNVQIPKGCPSKESMAEMLLREIGKKLDEVNGMYDIVKKKIYD
mgnify:CR=1 FL=1